MVIILLLVIITKLIYGYTIGKESNIIHEVVFTDADIQMYSNKEMYNTIRATLANKNMVMLKIKNGWRAKDAIRTTYPFIADMNIAKVEDNKISVSLTFDSAELVMRNDALSIAYTNKHLFAVTDNDMISSGAIFIELPAYFSGTEIEQNTTWYLSLLGPEKLKSDFTTIQRTLTLDHILFLAGTQKSIIISWNKKIVFDHKRSIKTQMEYLKTITPLDPALYYEIDLTTFPKIVIKKQTQGFIEQ